MERGSQTVMSNPSENTRAEPFLRLLSAVEPDISRYIFALAADLDATQDIYQETVMDLWQKFDEYDPSRPFVNWACRFAYIRVQRWRRAKGQAAAFRLDDDVMLSLSDEFLAARADLDARRHQLAVCLEKLPRPARDLLEQRYSQRQTVQNIARASGGSARTLYQRMDQIRHWLKDCIQRHMTSGAT
jgi:RNA polymerase sigma-70 factor, ECF subfamily